MTDTLPDPNVPGETIPDWMNQKSFVVVEAMLKLPWSGKGRRAFSCVFCHHQFEPGDTARWFLGGRRTPNTFVCQACDGPDVVERWYKFWAEVISPILDRWCSYR